MKAPCDEYSHHDADDLAAEGMGGDERDEGQRLVDGLSRRLPARRRPAPYRPPSASHDLLSGPGDGPVNRLGPGFAPGRRAVAGLGLGGRCGRARLGHRRASYLPPSASCVWPPSRPPGSCGSADGRALHEYPTDARHRLAADQPALLEQPDVLTVELLK